MKNIFLLSVIVLFIGCIGNKEENLTISNIYSDNAVLQRHRPISVWGHASPGEKIVANFNTQSKKTRTDKRGHWQLFLDAENAGGPYKMKISGERDTILLKNLLVGEVWICAGQSNMAMTVSKAADAKYEISNANFPLIRHIKIPNAISEIPQEYIGEANWDICSPVTAGNFTAVGYFFARDLFNELKVPIGLINCSMASTNVETWISHQMISRLEDYQGIRPLRTGELDQIGRKKNAATLMLLEKMGIDEKNVIENTEAWIKPEYDTSGWEAISVPGYWENILPGLDGVLYYRKEFYLPDSISNKTFHIHLGKIDDADITWVNGVKVGQTAGPNIERVYEVSPNVLKPGKNLIVVRVEDFAAEGGIWGEQDSIFISTADEYKKSLAGNWQFTVGKIYRLYRFDPNDYPGLLFNGVIAPLQDFTMRGVIWYQGESNVENAFQYRTTFPALISDWRNHWGLGDFPFIFVQLPNWKSGYGNSEKGSRWAELREAQAFALSLPNTGMAVTIDIGDEENIHPINKQDVSRRLAANSLKIAYRKDVSYSGPLYNRMEVVNNKAFIFFKNAGNGLLMKRKKTNFLTGFEVAGKDKEFYPANAIIQGNGLVVFSKKVEHPIAVRYGWADNPSPPLNLYNAEDFPAAPFRTDNWKGITESHKYKQWILED
jgi:sialate O-acetylesterase